MKFKIKINQTNNIDKYRRKFSDIKKRANFGDVVFVGLRALAVAIRREAPVGRNRSIPGNIKTSSVNKTKTGWTGVVYTKYGPAIFTNEGTATHAGGEEYPITRKLRSGKESTIMHPGIRGTGWWARGANKGSPLAFKAFKDKVDRVMKGGDR